MKMYFCTKFETSPPALKLFLALQIFYCMMKNKKIETDAGRKSFDLHLYRQEMEV